MGALRTSIAAASTRDRVPLAGEMRLIGVPEVGREVRQSGPRLRLELPDGSLEPQYSRGDLRRQPVLRPEPLRQMPPTPPDLPSQLLYADAARRLAQPPPGPAELGARLTDRLVPPRTEQQPLHDVEALMPVRCGPQSLADLLRRDAEQRVDIQHGGGELA